MRSAMAVGLLRRNGFGGATNLTGGIAAWAADVDPSMPRY
jgi:rhodanese-related sulfurtransferase